MIDFLSLDIRNYKCFDTYCGFGPLKNTNVVIGKNNSGKSSILDPIEMLVKNSFDNEIDILLGTVIQEDQARSAFPANMSGGEVAGNHWETVGKNLVGKGIKVRMVGAWAPSFVSFYDPLLTRFKDLSGVGKLATTMQNPFRGWTVRKIAAERDIRPEPENPGTISVSPSGDGATNAVQNIINNAQLDAGLIQVKFLKELNLILNPDIVIDGITIRRNPNNAWEIYLDDQEHGRVALSKCGSGLKTVILVLLSLQVLPALEKNSQNLFIFEELENNLHPAMQRRLMKFIHELVCSTRSILFLTTHSSIVIDLFSGDDIANVYSLSRTENGPRIQKLDALLSKKMVLSELGVHASDILQANSVIWIEGPSDRVYLKKLLELYGGGSLVEGFHYQFLYYGGRLLAHYSGLEEYDSDFINLLRVNTNCALVMDSDKRAQQTLIGKNKTRIQDELNELGMFVWTTAGREIENYIPNSVFHEKYSRSISRDLGRYEDIKDFLLEVSSAESRRFERNKVQYAQDIADLLTKSNTESVYDLAAQMNALVAKIKEWNRA